MPLVNRTRVGNGQQVIDGEQTDESKNSKDRSAGAALAMEQDGQGKDDGELDRRYGARACSKQKCHDFDA